MMINSNGRERKLHTVRQKAEALLREKYDLEAVAEDKELAKILHELRIYQIELELQNQELRHAQAELSNTQKRYFELFNFAPVGYFTFDEQGLIIDLNLRGMELLHRERRWVVGRPMIVHLDSPSRSRFFEHLDHVFATHTRQSCELTLVQLNGQKTYVKLESTAAVENERPVCRSTMTDITALKQAEAALGAEKERLSITLASIGEGVIATDTEGNISLINEVAQTLTGWSEAEALGRPVNDVLQLFDEQSGARQPCPVDEILATGRVGAAPPAVLRAKSGAETLLDSNYAPIRDPQGDLIGAVLVFRDISEQRKLEADRSRTQKLESLGLLAGGIAHDFNNLLVGIIGNISLLKMKTEDQALQQSLGEIETASFRAKGLTQQLLTFAKGGAPIKQLTSLSELLTNSVIFALRGSNVRPALSLANDLWHAEVDSGQISQVIQNLTINAVQAMPDGGTLAVKARNVHLDGPPHSTLPAGPYVRLTIRDEGDGIPAAHLDKIFDPYFTTKEGGNGLGLATSHAIIEKHEGQIEVRSEVGAGTTFTIYLPASSRKTVPETTSEKPINRDSLGKILIMDDDELVMNVLAGMLKHLGYSAERTTHGQQALEVYRQALESGQPFQAVIIDLTIPGGMGGKETIRALKGLDPQVKAIVSSGYSSDPIMSDYQEYGFSGVMVKPYRIQELHNLLGEIISD